MNEKELSQLFYLKREIKQQKLLLLEMETDSRGCVSGMSSVTGASGMGDLTGNRAAAIADLKRLTEKNTERLELEKQKLETYIQSVEDSYMRQLLRLRFAECKSWRAIALSMGGYNGEDGVRKAVRRFLEKNDKKSEDFPQSSDL